MKRNHILGGAAMVLFLCIYLFGACSSKNVEYVNYKIVQIDGCHYITSASYGSANTYTHKANCPNH